jgi:hypothetical protein
MASSLFFALSSRPRKIADAKPSATLTSPPPTRDSPALASSAPPPLIDDAMPMALS